MSEIVSLIVIVAAALLLYLLYLAFGVHGSLNRILRYNGEFQESADSGEATGAPGPGRDSNEPEDSPVDEKAFTKIDLPVAAFTADQSGGASLTLRRGSESARSSSPDVDSVAVDGSPQFDSESWESETENKSQPGKPLKQDAEAQQGAQV